MPLLHISRLTGCNLLHSAGGKGSPTSAAHRLFTGSLLQAVYKVVVYSVADRSGQKSKLHRRAGQSSGCDHGASVEGVSLGSEPWAIQAAGQS